MHNGNHSSCISPDAPAGPRVFRLPWRLDALLSGAVLVVAQVLVSVKDIHVHREDEEEEEEAHHAVSRPKSNLMPVILGHSDFLDSSHSHCKIWI